MTIKFVRSPGAAYEVAVGVTPKEAADAGLAIVEQTYSTNPPGPIYGRYLDAPDGSPLGVTVAKVGDTEVVGAGSVSAILPGSAGGDKGSLVNANDPVIHGGTDESVHADNGPPLVRDLQAEEKEARKVAEQSIEAASKQKK